ncbi:MAG TPA: LysR family transcriptional regulator [Burkholderiales bacterium]|nr:LysR family transcriptional regulator [Burkholderiales bacterium]
MDIRKVDLNLLVVFDVLLRLQSLTRTAEELGMSQPAMSLALNKLRSAFVDPLFVRVSRGLSPTPRAEQLAVPVRHVLDQIKNDVLRQPSFNPATTDRTFTFNMADVGELVFLPRLRAHLQAVAPGANIRTVSTPPGQLAEALQSSEVDLAVGYFPGLQGAVIYQQRLFSHSFVCIVRKDHPVFRSQITKKQFLEAQHVVVDQEGKSHELFEETLAAQGLARRVALRVPHFLSVPLVVAESDLIVTVPYAIGASFAKMANLTMLRPPIQVGRPEVKQHWHARFHHDQVNLWIRGVVADLFLDKPWGTVGEGTTTGIRAVNAPNAGGP